jgi:hypothetical protein
MMNVTINSHTVAVVRTKKYYKETAFWHDLKKAMQAMGFDVIKKLMYKDGHMVDDNQHYLRDRKWGYCVYDGEHAIRLVHEPERVILQLHRWKKK